MTTKFTYNDIVRAKQASLPMLRSGEKAWVVGVVEAEKRKGSYFDQFPPGVIYTIEFEDGASIDAHEDDLESGSCLL
jgi:hypothetical protein